jgi:alkylation response protein AidB-like acyl-CoA dehydrogenase
MNFDLSDEQRALRDAARDALTRHDLLGDAHSVLDGSAPVDLWPTACAAGWPGLLVPEAYGGAGLGAVEALLVAVETGRQLARLPLLGHTCACALMATAAQTGDPAERVGALLEAFAEGTERVAFIGGMPPTDLDGRWTTDAESGSRRAPLPTAERRGGDAVLDGQVSWVPDARDADALVVIALSDGAPVAVLVDARGEGLRIEETTCYDLTRPLCRVTFTGVRGTALPGVDAADIASAWFLAQAWIAAESLGAVETALERSVAYARERFTFGRPIGSYQAVKHGLVEMLRRLENARSLVYYAGWAHAAAREQFPLAASAARSVAGDALDFGARQQIVVHGGIGVTWEHDAPLYHRRAQVSRRLLGGTRACTDRVAEAMLSRTRPAA